MTGRSLNFGLPNTIGGDRDSSPISAAPHSISPPTTTACASEGTMDIFQGWHDWQALAWICTRQLQRGPRT